MALFSSFFNKYYCIFRTALLQISLKFSISVFSGLLIVLNQWNKCYRNMVYPLDKHTENPDFVLGMGNTAIIKLPGFKKFNLQID